jgi:two-component system sensor histidine kinase ChvG
LGIAGVLRQLLSGDRAGSAGLASSPPVPSLGDGGGEPRPAPEGAADLSSPAPLSRSLTSFLGIARFGTASLTAKLLALVGIFVALPIVLYGQFESADRKTRDLVTRSIQNRSWLISQALRPMLDGSQGAPASSLNAELDKYTDDGTLLELMLQPIGSRDERSFYYVASSPRVSVDRLNAQLDNLVERGILQRLSQSCSGGEQQEFRYKLASGQDEILTSVIPIRSRLGCWVLVSSHATSEFLSTSIARPYWQTREIQIAALIYLAAALLVLLITLSVRRNLAHFRHVARDIRRGRVGSSSFAARNILPELASVAVDFDRLVLDLHNVARHIRQTAEDNVHSFKGPLATIQAAVEPLRKLVTDDNPRAARALNLIDCSVTRLKVLVVATQHLDNNTAELIVSPRSCVNLTQLVAEALLNYREVMAERSIKLIRRLDENVMVRAGKAVLDIAIENILDNAISFSPADSVITVILSKTNGAIDLRIEDQGPGVDPVKLPRIFDRYFSDRPSGQAGLSLQISGDGHAGLGLWIVRRNIEALGGKVTASNCMGGGLSVHVVLPAYEI